MTPPNDHSSWAWFDSSSVEPPQWCTGEERDDDVPAVFARCFATADGQRVLRHLRRLVLDRALGPGSTDAHLRHAEGQRQLVVYMLALISNGASVPLLHR